MGNGLSGFDSLDIFFLLCAGIGGFFVVVKLILQFFLGGGGLDLDADLPDPHLDSDAGFRLLSLHGLSSFLMMFGLVGLALHRQSQAGLALSFGGAVAAGLVSIWIIGNLFRWAGRLQSSGNIEIASTVGNTGTVYLSIPEGGMGRVNITVRNRFREFDASEVNGAGLPTGTPVRVARVKGNTLLVEKID